VEGRDKGVAIGKAVEAAIVEMYTTEGNGMDRRKRDRHREKVELAGSE